jgi:ribosomal protein S18 acetylase RimI-like enzyme
MVHPDFHGTDVAASLMRHGIDWLGETNPIWLNVIRHNERAIRFYRRFGFEVDPNAKTAHIVPHVIMRRRPSASPGHANNRG